MNLDKKTRLKLAFAISSIFVIIEIVGGVLSNSLG
jgi:Co/Zn/Cd efflux system component